jgi:hypothetical protein
MSDEIEEVESGLHDSFRSDLSDLSDVHLATSLITLPHPKGDSKALVGQAGDIAVVLTELSEEGPTIALILVRHTDKDMPIGLINVLSPREAREIAASLTGLADQLDPQGKQ